ncbi:ABC transporter permease [Streptosporangium sp. NPDC051023]|uniref:ABC transporter permease n=1 Tax=Streptosporangium sp. NPDC051023 TaxID=3155410 RepID=UPI00344B6C47
MTTLSTHGTRRRLPRIVGLDLPGHLALAGVVLFAFLATFGPLLAPHDPNAVELSQAYWGPDASHWLGYDGQGRDIVSRLLVGARSSFLGPLAIVVLATTLGMAVAVVAAWRGGWVDTVLAGVLDAALSFPGLLLAVIAVAVLGTGPLALVIALAMAYVPYIARVVRSAALAEIGKDYVDALTAQGLSGVSICVRHVVPNVLPMVMGQAALTLAWATVDLTGLSYLGLGVQPPSADWGVMVSTGQAGVLAGYPGESIASGICLIAAICSFSLVGNRLLRRAEELAA